MRHTSKGTLIISACGDVDTGTACSPECVARTMWVESAVKHNPAIVCCARIHMYCTDFRYFVLEEVDYGIHIPLKLLVGYIVGV